MALLKLTVPPDNVEFVNEALKWGTILLVAHAIAGQKGLPSDPLTLYLIYLTGLSAYHFVVKELVDVVVI